MPETFPLAVARLEALDLDNLHGGVGSDLLLADATSTSAASRPTASAAISLARRSLVSGAAGRERRARLPVRGRSRSSRPGSSTRRSRAYDAAHARPSGAATCCARAPIAMFRGRAKLLRGDVDVALAELRDALERITALRIAAAFPYAVSFLAEALLERGEPAEAEGVLAAAGAAGRAAA